MTQFFISCKESRIENNRSFYGCFYLGPFEPSQSLTIANTLRRTLLSEIYGLGIVSVEIDGANHEYSSLPGVRDSVLDILLNLKEIVLKKTIKHFKPQIGYLRVRGPGVVLASHLRLPLFIQCVDPNQYIATLSENGFLNMKFVIQYGNKWLSSSGSSESVQDDFSKELNDNKNVKIIKYSNNPFNLYLKKRRLILKKLKNISFGTNSFLNKKDYLNMLSKSSLFLRKYSKAKLIRRKKRILQNLLINRYPGINLKTGIFKRINKSTQSESLISQTSQVRINKKYENGVKKMVFLNSKPLVIDAIFNPINKINYIIETNDFKESPSKLQLSGETAQLNEMLNTNSNSNSFLSLNGSNEDTHLKTAIQDNFQLSGNKKESLNKISSEIVQSEIETILDLKSEINMLKKDSIKHNLILEIWTNGSIHPRDALYQSFKSLIKLFSKLKKVNTFGIDNFQLNTLDTIQLNKLTDQSTFVNNFNKKIKMGGVMTPLLQDLIPLNETAFLATYTNSKLRSYYLNNQNFKEVINTPLFINQETKTYMSPILNSQKEIVEANRGFVSTNKVEQKVSYYKSDVGILKLSLRSYTILKRLQINTIEQLVSLSKTQLLKRSEDQNCRLNPSNLTEIEASLNQINLNLS